MSIDELRERKTKLAQDVRAAIIEFEKETGVQVVHLDHDRFSYNEQTEAFDEVGHKISMSLEL